ncbi:Membrane protein involved in the export of O-antigen and teichoic acid, partial [Candidatus Methanophagaceae archaeon]
WVFAGSTVVLILHFFQKPLLARYLGPDGLGLFSMALMIIGIIELIVIFGIDSALIKFVAEYTGTEHKHKRYSLVSSAFITMMIMGMITSLALFASANTFACIFNMPSLSLLLKIYACIFPFSLTYAITISYFNGLRKMRYYALIRVLQAFLTLSFILAFLMSGFGVKGAVLGTMFAIIITTCVAIVIVKKIVHFTIRDYKKNMKMLASFGSRLFGANMIGEIYTSIDTIMIGYFLTSTDVGYYAVAISLSRFFWLVPRAMRTVAYPAISEYWAKDNHQAINRLVDKSLKYSACILIFAGMFVTFFAKDIVDFMFTSEFSPAVLPLTILIIGTVIYGIIGSIGGIFASVGKVSLTLIISAIHAVVSVLLNIALIPIYGIVGAATATAASYVLTVGIILYYLRTALSIKLDTFWYTKMAILIGLSVALFYAFDFLNYYLSAMIALLLYAIVVIKYLLTKEDRDYFVNIAKHLLHGDFIKP